MLCGMVGFVFICYMFLNIDPRNLLISGGNNGASSDIILQLPLSGITNTEAPSPGTWVYFALCGSVGAVLSFVILEMT